MVIAVFLQLYSYLFTIFLFQISGCFPMFYSILLSSGSCLLESGIFFPFLACILFFTLIIYPPSILSKSFFFTVDISYSLFYNIITFFLSLLIFAHLSLLFTLLWFIFKILSLLVHYFLIKTSYYTLPFPYSILWSPFLFYLWFYFLPFFTLFLFPTLIISLPSSVS